MSSRVIESLLSGPAAPRAFEPAPRAAEEHTGFGPALDQALQADGRDATSSTEIESADTDLPDDDDPAGETAEVVDEALDDAPDEEAESPADDADGVAADAVVQSVAASAAVTLPLEPAATPASGAADVPPASAESPRQAAPAADEPDPAARPSIPEPAPRTDVSAALATKAPSHEFTTPPDLPIEDGGNDAVPASSAPAAPGEISQQGDQLAPTATTHIDADNSNDVESAPGHDGEPAASAPQGDAAPTPVADSTDPTRRAPPANGDPAPIEHAADDSPAPPAPVASDAQPGTTGGAAPLARLASGRTLHAAPQRGEAGTVEHVDRDRFVGRVEGAIRMAQQRDGRVQVRLSPPELGSLRIELTIEQGVLSARLEAETSAARKVLLDNLPALRERLAQQDVRVDRFDVDVRREGGGSSGGPQDRPAGDPAPRHNDDRRERETAHQRTTVRLPQAPRSSTTPDAALDVRV